jgi:hypothetical protein
MVSSTRPAIELETLMRQIGEFDAMGIHRTGTPGDDQATEWLIEQLAIAGVRGESHAFRFPRLTTSRASVEIGGVAIDGHAHMDAGLTPRGGVTAPLAPAESPRSGTIAVLDIDVGGTAGHGIEAAIERCAREGAAGLVVASRRGEGSFFLMNATRLMWPAPLPVLFVPQGESAPLVAGAAGGAPARLTVEGERVLGTGTNVVARIAADAPVDGARPLGVMTPKSGWFTCAAERGGGIVIWLAAARVAAAMTGRTRDVVLLATSGHELGHAGLESYLLEHPALATDVERWIHLGASIGAAVQPATNLFASDRELSDWAGEALREAEAGPYRVVTSGIAPGGEARNVATRGGRFVSLAGGHAFFHTPEDRPDKVDPASVARYATAVTNLVRSELARGG